MSQVLATVPARIARIPVMHNIAALFPEVPSIAKHPVQELPGFADAAAGGVPTRKPGFLQEEEFLFEFLSFLARPNRWMFTLFGPTGCGKSERVLDVYSRMNVPVHRFVATTATRMHDFLYDIRPQADGTFGGLPKPLYKAMKNGHPFLIDEVYRLDPRVTSKLHQIRDRGEIYVDETGETLVAKPGFKFICTANHGGLGDDTGQYVGDATQDMAWLNGSLTFKCDYPTAAVEIPIVQRILESKNLAFRNDPTMSTYATNMVKVASQARAAMAGDPGLGVPRIELPFSTRNLEMWAEAFIDYSDFPVQSGSVHALYRSLDSVMANRACESTRNALDSFILANFKVQRLVP